jgi:L-lactate dehydrogenase complex protein LldF
MPDAFHHQIERSLGSPNLQAALDANAENRALARLTAYTSLPEDWLVLRRRAHLVRKEVIAHLEEHLEQFTERLIANGVQVHLAADAAEARALVLEIARRHDVRLVAKAKTMVGEEIEINPALEAAGIEVVETDLGEYIVQLRGEAPAHIVTPAVHLRRDDVGRTFEEKLDLPYTEDIPTLTNAARQVLRRTFLQADMGISGVNFGVVETGGLCLVTNEGNGRMVTTLPRVHVALMGIERLAPTMKDLALLLSLLPRSSTGQKLSVYTSLIHTPRRPGENEGPLERHVILVDNGRRALRASALQEILYCIRCGACLNACPVFRELGGHAYVSRRGAGTPYTGPLGSVVSPGLFGEGDFGQLARASSLCGACKEVCPVDIDLPRLLLRVRAGGKALPPRGGLPQGPVETNAPAALKLGLNGFAWAAASPWRFRLAQRLAAWLAAPLARAGWLRLPAATGWGLSRDFPAPARSTFRARWQSGLDKQPMPERVPSPAAEPAAPPTVEDSTSTEQPSALDRFSQELAALGGEVRVIPASQALPALQELLAARHAGSVLSWAAEALPPGLLGGLAQAGIQVATTYDPQVELQGGAAPLVGLSGALSGIAESGSLVLDFGSQRPPSTSLVCATHIALLPAAALVGTLEEALAQPELAQASSAVVITGPSRTADIEMTLTIGVHGPKELVVLLLT